MAVILMRNFRIHPAGSAQRAETLWSQLPRVNGGMVRLSQGRRVWNALVNAILRVQNRGLYRDINRRLDEIELRRETMRARLMQENALIRRAQDGIVF